MAKPFPYVIELTKEEAQVFLNDILDPKPNPARDATMERVKNMKFNVI